MFKNVRTKGRYNTVLLLTLKKVKIKMIKPSTLKKKIGIVKQKVST